jgi:hypothetical protein
LDDIITTKRCASCPELVLYWGPEALRNASVCCSPVCEALWDALTPGVWGLDGAPCIRYLAFTIAEVKLHDVAVQVMLGAMLIDARHAALEDREKAFHRVR